MKLKYEKLKKTIERNRARAREREREEENEQRQENQMEKKPTFFGVNI